MISLPVVVTTKSVPDSYDPPTDMQGILEAIPQYTDYELNDTGANITINATGAGADLNGLWVWMLNQYNQPPRLMTGYRNNWWRVYTGLPSEIRMFMGAPSGYFDASGRGIEESGWEGWAICNGNNGTINLSTHFIVPGYRTDGVGWVTDVTVTLDANSTPYDTYGNSGPNRMQIGYANLPRIDIWFPANDFLKWAPKGGELWTTTAPGIASGNWHQGTWTFALDQSPWMTETPLSIIPPYIAVGYVQFVGYL